MFKCSKFYLRSKFCSLLIHYTKKIPNYVQYLLGVFGVGLKKGKEKEHN